jgi:hypothetical protein
LIVESGRRGGGLVGRMDRVTRSAFDVNTYCLLVMHFLESEYTRAMIMYGGSESLHNHLSALEHKISKRITSHHYLMRDNSNHELFT